MEGVGAVDLNAHFEPPWFVYVGAAACAVVFVVMLVSAWRKEKADEEHDDTRQAFD